MAAGTGSLLGNGATFVLSAGSVGTIISIEPPEESRAIIEDDSLAITSDHEKIPGLLTEHGVMSMVCIFNPDDVAPMASAVLAGTLTFRPRTGQTVGATYAGTGFVCRRKVTSIENDVRATLEVDWQFDGKTGPAYSAGS